MKNIKWQRLTLTQLSATKMQKMPETSTKRHDNILYKEKWFFMLPQGQTGRRRHDVLNLSVCLVICPSDVRKLVNMIFWKLNKPISTQIGITGPSGKGMNWSTLGARGPIYKTSYDNHTTKLWRWQKLWQIIRLTRFTKNHMTKLW